ncbi:hypothetical protein SAMN05660706_12055 [Desulfoscipio geothermicus DSM 3669]|uniref:Uncharacterized protein n=1 Tax=Desulfoscipio geothermicus DSM 3669 TaxID=1121426 RepID=A0A1I6DXX3_9FIRM|nr:hypothetical protein SAMN05660706_12055 [Desulfoscipio geothermicus DSM 3669]
MLIEGTGAIKIKCGIKCGMNRYLTINKKASEPRRPCHYWRECVRIELTRDGIAAPRLVLKTRRATRPHPPPLVCIFATLFIIANQS